MESGIRQILSAPLERPNIFKLYEENIGPLTPLIADALKDAEEIYSAEWIAETIELAVKNNKRNWKYCEAILKRWKEEGRAEKQDRRDAEKDRRQIHRRRIRRLHRALVSATRTARIAAEWVIYARMSPLGIRILGGWRSVSAASAT